MNYHLFVANKNIFKFYLEYMFWGIGKSETRFDIKLWKEMSRLKKGDKVVFYVPELKKIYGVFEINSAPFFDKYHYLQPSIIPYLGNKKIKLQYKVFIKPFIVFQQGIDEDELLKLLPKNFKWSILHRNVKKIRLSNPLFVGDFKVIFQKIVSMNRKRALKGSNFSFFNEEIKVIDKSYDYKGSKTIPDIKKDILENNYKEEHLHSLLIQFLNGQESVKWLGNDVYSGAGIETIDILTIDSQNVFNVFEIKKDEIGKTLKNTILKFQKYIYWFKNRFKNSNSKNYRPLLIEKRDMDKTKLLFKIKEFIEFNNLKISLPIFYLRYEIDTKNKLIKIYQYDYINNYEKVLWKI